MNEKLIDPSLDLQLAIEATSTRHQADLILETDTVDAIERTASVLLGKGTTP